jgi:hypothetical protein
MISYSSFQTTMYRRILLMWKESCEPLCRGIIPLAQSGSTKPRGLVESFYGTMSSVCLTTTNLLIETFLVWG